MPPNRAQFHFEHGLNFIQKGDYEKASTYFKEAILEEPQFHEALYNLACCQAMVGDKDNALIYLSRAINLNMHCIDWAKEDKEFHSIKDDPLFQKLVNPQDDISPSEETEFTPSEFPQADEVPVNQENATSREDRKEVHADKEDMPNLTDEKDIIEDLPPCSNCGGILHTDKRTHSSPKQLSLILAAGIGLCFLMYFTIFGILGFAVIAFGLYSLTQIDTVWVCNSCGLAGEECGQPKETMKSKHADNLKELAADKK